MRRKVEVNYTAFGLKIAGISSTKLGDNLYEGYLKNNNLYNDKELFDDGDLNWYDYGFRNYDAQIGRFTQLDPLTDGYPYYTPYQYAGNEPIANIDIDGLEPGTSILGNGLNGTTKVLGEVVVKAAPRAAQAASTATRVWGGVKALGSLVEMAAGAVGGIATSWTGVGAVLGGVAVVHGADGFAAGLQQAWTGQETKTFTEQGISQGLQAAGVSIGNADVAAGYADGFISVALTWGAGAAKIGAFMAKAGAQTAAKGVTNLIPEGKLANHLFKGARKLADNPANRSLIQKISNGKALGIDPHGKSWFFGVDGAGKSIYSYAEKGIVKGAGYASMTAEEMIIKYGLK